MLIQNSTTGANRTINLVPVTKVNDFPSIVRQILLTGGVGNSKLTKTVLLYVRGGPGGKSQCTFFMEKRDFLKKQDGESKQITTLACFVISGWFYFE